MTDLILDETFGDRLASSGYVRGVSLPGNAMYTADVSLERDPQQNRSVMVTLTEDAFILTSFTFPTAEVSGEAVDGARDAGDGYSRTQLHDHWVIGERIDGGILPDFSGWAPVLADADMVQRILSFKGQTQIHIEGMPFADGATMCALVPVTINGQPVVLGLGGSLERVRENQVRYAEILRRAVAAL